MAERVNAPNDTKKIELMDAFLKQTLFHPNLVRLLSLVSSI